MSLAKDEVVEQKPDQSYLDTVKSYLESAYATADEEIDALRMNRDLMDPPVMPEWLRTVHTTVQIPTVRDEIARVVATLTMRWPTCAATPGEPGSDLDQDYSTDLEHFLEEVTKVSSQRVPGRDTQVMVTDGCVGDGGGVVKWVYDRDRWESVYRLAADEDADEDEVEDEKKRRGPPLARIPVDVRTWYPVWEADELSECLEVSQRQTYPLLKQYDLALNEQGAFEERLGRPLSRDEANRLPSTVEFCEHWTKEWVSYWVHSGKASHLIKQIHHGYGQVPYFFMPGLVHNYQNDIKCGLSVASNKLELTRFRSFLATAMVNMAARQASAPTVYKKQASAEAMEGEDRSPDKVPTFDIPQGMGVTIGTEEEFKVAEQPGIPTGLENMFGIISSLESAVDTPKPGPSVGGDLAGAGFAIQSILAESKTRHHPFVASIERAMEQESYFVIHLIQNVIKEKVWVRRSLAPGAVARPADQWIGMGPEDLEAAVGIRWTLDPEPATSKIVEARWIAELLQAGLISKEIGMAHLGFNPDEVREGQIRDQVRNEPWYKQFVQEQLLRKLRRFDIMKQAATAATQSGVLPGMDPMLANMAQQARGGGFGAPMALPPGAAPGGPMMPDQAALAAAPGGVGAAPVPSPFGQIGANMGMPTGPILPQNGIVAGAQSIGV